MLETMERDLSAVRWTAKCSPDTWGIEESTFNLEMYICSSYFIVTTTATVGYGDISASTSIERLFCMVLMLIGVACFTFLAGSLG
jgi:voltage-gated potassium channel Kch